jgi:DNA polymerase-1
MKAQLRLLTAGNLKVLNEIYIPLIFTLNYMERVGVKVDVNCLAALYSNLIPQAQELDQRRFAPLGLNPSSPIQLTKYFGLINCQEKTLLYHIKRGHPQAELMQARLDYVHLTKGASTFLKGIYDKLEDSRAHTNYHPEGTGTGRISSSKPNLQNIPPAFRIIYIADTEDDVLIESDYSQLELVVAAILGGETGLLEEVKHGIKPHHVLGKIIFGKEWDELTKEEQFREKAVLFGTLGGRTARSIAIEFGISTYEAEYWQTLCVNKYPGLLRYKQNCEREFQETGKISTAFGTSRIVQSITQAYNNPFQGSASFITLTTLNKLYKRGFDIRLTVHDSIIVQAKRKEVREVVRELAKIMERPIRQLNNHRFQAIYKFGHNWYEQEELKV